MVLPMVNRNQYGFTRLLVGVRNIVMKTQEKELAKSHFKSEESAIPSGFAKL